MLSILSFVLGPVSTNAYLIADTETGDAAAKHAVVIDPGGEASAIVRAAQERDWQIKQIWLTHGHFDHFLGVSSVEDGFPSVEVALHPEDMPLWQHKGGASLFGMDIDPGPEPTLNLEHHQTLNVGRYTFQVRHAPGHTPGHVIFYCESEKVLFSGDVIFQSSIGRTDLPGGDYATLMKSINEQVLSLPDDVRILPGHMGETTVGAERRGNVFLG